MNTNNQNKSASKRMRFALWLASKNAGQPTDYRNVELTQTEAIRLLKQFNESTGYNNGKSYGKKTQEVHQKKSDEETYKEQFIEFFKKEYLDKVVANLNNVLKQVSEVYNADVFGNDLGGKRYKFYGTGCAVAWLEFRKCKRYEEINRATGHAYNNEIIEIIKSNISPEIIKQLADEGNHIEAIICQDYSFRQLEMQARARFLEMNGAKNVRIRVHYD